MAFRPVSILLVAAALVACSADPDVPPGATGSRAPTNVAAVGPTTTTAAPVAPSISPQTSAVRRAGLPEGRTSPVEPIYPNPATERWVPAPESGDAIDDFARLVLGWPDVQVVSERDDGPVRLIRVTTTVAPQPVELVVAPDAGGGPVAVCGARSAVDGQWVTSVLVEGADVVSKFGIRVDDTTVVAVHEVLPDVVSAQLLISHGPDVQQVAATDPEQGWRFALDHPTTEPGWQLALWRDADGAALAVTDSALPAGDVATN